ncbi:MAG: amidohydrolase [Sphingopyxis sp.]
MTRYRHMILATAALCALSAPAAAQGTPDLGAQIRADMPSLMDLYRDMHAHPELSFMEVQSAARLAGEGRRLGFDVTENVGGHGVVAVLRNGPGPVLLIRADMDALPVTEPANLPYASRVRVTTAEGVETGVMHACGHDTHMAAWIGTARALVANRAAWSGTLVMIGQPAEERGAGARSMLNDGLFTRFPKPTHALAFHDAAQFPAGMIGFTPGFALANVDSVDVTVRGVGGHGAYPHTTRDPIVLASRIVGTLQTLVSREVDPQDAAVVTVGSFHAGTKHNIIGEEARLQLTVRSYSDATRRLLLDGIARIARGEAMATGVPEDRLPVVHIEENDFTPSTFNTPDFTNAMAAFMRARFGAGRVVQVPPSMGGEDFSEYWRADNSMQSMIFWVGGTPQAEFDAARASGGHLPSLHSPNWQPDAAAVISTATEAMTAMAMEILKP